MAEYEDVGDTPGNKRAQPRAELSNNPVVNLIEKSFSDSSYWEASQIKPYNPDDLVQQDFDYRTYEDMTHDDQISVCLQLKKDLVLASGFDIISEGDQESDAEMKEYLEVALCEDPHIPFLESLEEVLTAYEYGFSVSEKIFKLKEDGLLSLKCIKPRHPVTWLLHTDTHGNMVRYEQRGPRGSLDIDPSALIHYVNNRRFSNPYGTSDLRVAYDAWFIKRQIIKFYAIYLEKAASPTPVGRYDQNAPEAAVDKLFEALKKLQTKSALVLPKEIEMEFLEAKSDGEAYIKGINLFNMFIGRALMIPDLLGFQGSETSGGSYSLGKDQMAVFFKHIGKRRSQIEDIVNKEIIKPIVRYNFGEVDKYPKFKLRPISDEDAMELAKLWIEGVKGKFYTPSEEEINHFRKLAKFPEGSVEYPEAPTQGMVLPIEDAEEEANPQDSKEAEPQQEKEPQASDSQSDSGSSSSSDKKEFKRIFNDTPGEYSKKTNFKLIENNMNSLKDAVITEANPVIQDIYDDLIKQIKQKKILQTQDLDKIDKIKIKFGSKLKQILKSKFREAHKAAKSQAQSELLKGNFALPLENEDFLEFLEKETFQYIGDFEYQIKKNVRLKLVQAIKDGLPLSEIAGILSKEGIELSEISLERYARTKFTEVMNRGRHEFFEESGVVAAYQYSAILDDRTTEICDGLHGKIFAKGDEPIPPLHFNCRSLLIPITKYEDWKADKSVGGKNIDKFIEDESGEGFSKQ